MILFISKHQDVPKIKSEVIPDAYLVHSSYKRLETNLRPNLFGIKLPIVGTENYIINGTKYPLSPSHFMTVNADSKGAVIIKDEEDVKGLCLGFNRTYIDQLFFQSQLTETEQLELKEGKTSFALTDHTFRFGNDPLSKFLMKLKRTFQFEQPIDNLDVHEYYYNIANLLFEHQNGINQQVNQLSQSKKSTREETFKRIDLMDQIIHDRFQEPITLEEICKAAYLSKYHAIRAYRQIKSISPYQKIIALRLEKGKSLLEKGESVNQVAMMTSFSDRRAFTRAFVKHYGFAPSLIRKK